MADDAISVFTAQVPVQRHSDWRHLLRWLASYDAAVGRLRQHDLKARLVSVVTLARAWAWQGLRPKDSQTLRVLVVGAEELDTFDHGRWYGLLPALLGLNCACEMIFLGPKLHLERSRFSSLAPHSLPPVQTRGVTGTLAETWTLLPQAHLDLIMLMQPGFENHAQWFSGPDMALLAQCGLPVLISSYGTDEFYLERRVLQAYGFGVAAGPELNPLYFEMGHARIRWGHSLWRLASQAPTAHAPVDRATLEHITRLSRLLTRLFQTGQLSDALDFGQRELEVNEAGKVRTLRYLAGEVYGDLRTGELVRWRQKTPEPLGAKVSAIDLAAFPVSPGDPLDRALWVTDVLYRYLGPGS